MRVLVVIAHPVDDSFCRAVFDSAVTALRTRHEVDAIDLYADGFEPVMSREERRAYQGTTPILDPLTRRYAASVKSADVLVFIYPTWWSGPPAILKGWLDKVMVPGVAFGFDDAGKVSVGLRNVRRIIGVSTYGSTRATVRLVNDNGRRMLVRALRLCTGLRTRSTWLGLYDMPNRTVAQRTAFIARVVRRMESL